ncbi:MAG: bifunctional UDP-sugar hydrolase/5'-nucleotidase [Bacteroidales bacterium]|nr:bifunctional UDP-sugar hydrolase/5'-nucleotidase [Bacteroidales bacterium]
MHSNYRISSLQILLYFFFLLACIFFTGCQNNSTHASRQLTILAINDIHGNIEALPRLTALAEQCRQEHDNMLLLSAGDLFIGNAYVDDYPAKGFPIIDMMNVAGFDLSTLGNHEFDFGRDTLVQRMREAEFPFLCANVTGFDSTQIAPLPYKIFRMNGLTIGIIGLIITGKTSGIPPTSAKNIRGLTFSDPIETALSYKWLRDSCDLFIALTHIGIDNDIKLAKKMPELDWIIGGHSHTFLKSPEKVNGVGITQNGKSAEYATLLTFRLDNRGKKSVDAGLVHVNEIKNENEKSAKLYKKYVSGSSLNYKIGYVKTAYDSSEELGYLMTDALTALNDIDMAVINPGGVRLKKLPAGELTAKRICDLDPFGNTMVVYELTESGIASLIQEEYRQSGMYLIPSGFRYNATKPFWKNHLQDIELFQVDGTPLEKGKKYRVAMNNYIAENYTFEEQVNPFYSGVPTTGNLIRYIKGKKSVAPDRQSRINIKSTLF